MANWLKLVLDSLIHEDQNGFIKGRNIGCNIRNIIDLIEYAGSSDIPGSIVLLVIAKAFDRVENILFYLRSCLDSTLVIT